MQIVGIVPAVPAAAVLAIGPGAAF